MIPQKVLDVAARAQAALEAKPEAERKAFIEKKAHVWRAFARYLAKMSYGKCWYSESNDPQSFFDVDHFRPKKAAKRADAKEDDGYPWLAFSVANFRYAAGRSNRLSTDEATEETVGKGSWFPLLDGSPCASWVDRCVDQERPVLLDPTVRGDVALIDIDPDDGRAVASRTCLGAPKQLRVARSIELYGLNLGNLITARKRVMRDVENHYKNLMDIVGNAADMAAVDRLQEQMREATVPSAPYARAARSKMFAMGAGAFCAQPEDIVKADQ
ncbi:hypothetical protein KAK06_22010 [Ideonella sp. 4Y11]|uniref:HNH endonuclease n=1 Tax=Ideonella aquatica TaxID=2824119 RepID=A0A941BI61_9BURK|nr:hypothetical protein [Ideonella aquatica]MBQ0961631.1 hypothetical protein [Ideonella aquatica]